MNATAAKPANSSPESPDAPQAGVPPAGGGVVVEGGIAKFPAGRLAEEARAAAEAAYARAPTDAVYRIAAGTPIAEVNALAPAPGATILFERGGVWRGQLQAASGTPGHPVRYGAFGDGPAPAIQPSLDATDPAAWREEPDGLWRFDTGSPNDVGNVLASPDPPTAGGAGGPRLSALFKRGSRDGASRDGDFFFDAASGAVLLRSASGNPAARWRTLELAQKLNAVDEPCVHDVVYEGLAVRYAAAHGFGGGDTARVSIRDCDVSWIGGGYLYRDDLGNGVRYGNGIEFWGGAEDILVEGCRVGQCWDAGLTNQSNMPGSVQRNVVWRGNRVSACEYSFEFWHQGEGGAAEGIRLEDNVFLDAGSGWGHAQRWNPNGAHLMFYDTTLPTPGFAVARNRFGRSAGVAVRVFNDWRGQASFDGNDWTLDGGTLCRFHGRPRSGLRYLYPDRLDRIHDDDAREIESQGTGACLFPATPEGLRRLAGTVFGA